MKRTDKYLTEEKKEFVLSKQLLRSGTSIGANIAEANGAISKADFSAKMSIAYKESLETKYWISLLKDTDYINEASYKSLYTDAMDRAVLDAYGWTDIPTDCEFLLDYEEEEDESNSRRKKPWRYRWPEDVHDEVLARLLDLNQKRHEAEILGGKHAETKAKSNKGRKTKATKSTQTNVQQPGLFGE